MLRTGTLMGFFLRSLLGTEASGSWLSSNLSLLKKRVILKVLEYNAQDSRWLGRLLEAAALLDHNHFKDFWL